MTPRVLGVVPFGFTIPLATGVARPFGEPLALWKPLMGFFGVGAREVVAAVSGGQHIGKGGCMHIAYNVIHDY